MLIDPKSNVPVYRQIVDQISRAIESGVYRPGEALPSQRALAAEIRVNPNTVQRAFDELLRDGVIESRRGLGMFVLDRRRAAARSGAERSAAKRIRQAILAGLRAGLTPERMRQLFETEMRCQVTAPRNSS